MRHAAYRKHPTRRLSTEQAAPRRHTAPAQKGIDKKHLWVGCRTGQKEDMF